MKINLRRLNCFIAVAEQGNFGRAADALAMSKTALSEQIQLLEQEWELRLFERNARGAVLTQDGQALLEESRLLVRHAHSLSKSVSNRRQPCPTVFRLGFGALAAGEVTTSLIAVIKSMRSNLDVRLTHLSYARQIHAVLDAEVDASIVRGPIDPVAGLRFSELGTEPRMVMVSSSHPMAGRTSVCVADLDRESRVTTEGVPEKWRRWWSLDPASDGTTPPYSLLIHSWEEQVEAAASSLAISIVPATAARIYSRSDVAFVPISDAQPCAILLCSRDGDTASWLELALSAARAAWTDMSMRA